MSSYNYILTRYHELLTLRQTLVNKLKSAPAGTLVTTLHQGRYQYRQKLHNAKPVYIKKSDRELAHRLAAKAVRKQRLKDVEREILAIEAYLGKYDGTSFADRFLKSHEGHRILAEEWGAVEGSRGLSLLHDANWVNKVKKDPVAYELLLSHTVKDAGGNLKWNYEPATPTADYQDRRIIKATCGIMVRTKSEAIFANELYRAGLLYIYEPRIRANGRIYHPDFVIFHPVTGDLVIFEYLGLLPDEYSLFDEANTSAKSPLARTETFNGDPYVPANGQNLRVEGSPAADPRDIWENRQAAATIQEEIAGRRNWENRQAAATIQEEIARKKIQYRNSNAERIRDYIKEGYLPGRTLIVMSETSNMPLDMLLGSRLIDCYFGD